MARLLVNGVNKGNIRIRDIKTECFGIDENARIYLYFSDNEKILLSFHNKPESFNAVKTLAMGIRHWFKEYPYFIYEIDVVSSDNGDVQIMMFQDDYGILKCNKLEWDYNNSVLKYSMEICDHDSIDESCDDEDFDRSKKNRRAILVEHLCHDITLPDIGCAKLRQYIDECDFVDIKDFYARLNGSFLKIDFGSMIHINKYITNKEHYNIAINDIRDFICNDTKSEELIEVKIINLFAISGFADIVFKYKNISTNREYTKTLRIDDSVSTIITDPIFELNFNDKEKENTNG